MVKHTQTICRQQPTNCLNVFDHFVKWALKGFIPLHLRSFKEIKIICIQFLIFKPLSYCFEETIGFDVKASFASPPESHLIR